MTCTQVRLTLLPASSLFGPESGYRAGWILEEKSWTWSPRTCSLPKRVIAQRQQLRSGSLAVPTIHMQQTAGAESSVRQGPQPSSHVWDCAKSTGFGGQPGLGSNLSFQTVWLMASDQWLQSPNSVILI